MSLDRRRSGNTSYRGHQGTSRRRRRDAASSRRRVSASLPRRVERSTSSIDDQRIRPLSGARVERCREVPRRAATHVARGRASTFDAVGHRLHEFPAGGCSWARGVDFTATLEHVRRQWVSCSSTNWRLALRSVDGRSARCYARAGRDRARHQALMRAGADRHKVYLVGIDLTSPAVPSWGYFTSDTQRRGRRRHVRQDP